MRIVAAAVAVLAVAGFCATDLRAGLDLRQGEGCLVLSHGGGPAALGIVVEDARPAASPGWAVLSDNVIDLLPGETRELSLEWRDVPDTGRELSAEGWNVMARLS